MANVFNKETGQIRYSVNTPDFTDPWVTLSKEDLIEAEKIDQESRVLIDGKIIETNESIDHTESLRKEIKLNGLDDKQLIEIKELINGFSRDPV